MGELRGGIDSSMHLYDTYRRYSKVGCHSPMESELSLAKAVMRTRERVHFYRVTSNKEGRDVEPDSKRRPEW